MERWYVRRKSQGIVGSVEGDGSRVARWIDEDRPSVDSDARQSVMNEVWPTLPKIAIDHAVAEPASKVGKVAVIPATFGWDDVGDFSSLADLIPAEEGEPRILGDSRLVVTESQAGGLIIPAAGRPIACLGVDDVVIVDTPDALLVTTRARAQEVKKIVGRTKKVYLNFAKHRTCWLTSRLCSST